ncbi:MAG: NYN domain-containing protein [Dehalococcoidia bacterium]|jgi:uncharacterized LabA/DUF88 family protein
MKDRVIIFIDGSNLYHSLKNNFKRVDLNFAEFTKKLVGPRHLIRTYYYNVLQEPVQRTEGVREQQDFLETLRKTPYLELRLGTTKLSQGVPVERGIDVMLATDLLYFASNNSYDIAILVSGDSDFGYTLQVVKNMGKHVEVAYFENAASRDLLNSADTLHELDRKFFTGLWAGTGSHPYAAARRRKPHYRQQAPAAIANNAVREETLPFLEPRPDLGIPASPDE